MASSFAMVNFGDACEYGQTLTSWSYENGNLKTAATIWFRNDRKISFQSYGMAIPYHGKWELDPTMPRMILVFHHKGVVSKVKSTVLHPVDTFCTTLSGFDYRQRPIKLRKLIEMKHYVTCKCWHTV